MAVSFLQIKANQTSKDTKSITAQIRTFIALKSHICLEEPVYTVAHLTRMFHELLSRDRADGRATGQPQGVGPEAYLNGTSQGPTPEDARKDGHIRAHSKLFMKHPG